MIAEAIKKIAREMIKSGKALAQVEAFKKGTN